MLYNQCVTQFSSCRICKAPKLDIILELGSSPISGHFPKLNEEVESLPLNLARCSYCGLIQLYNILPISELYTETYGYESHLNSSMQNHLINKALKLQKVFQNRAYGKKGVFLDIASNDGTLLSGYAQSSSKNTLIGIDPLITNFDNFYPEDAIKIQNFFSATVYKEIVNMKADVISSISVFYDLDKPLDFARDIHEILSEDGIWHLEQSYCVSMLKKTSFDTICHEHLLYLRAHDFQYIFDKIGFTVIAVQLNEINGGSIAITVEKTKGGKHCQDFVDLLESEINEGYCEIGVYNEFARKVETYKNNLLNTIHTFKSDGYKIFGLGASTKGNIILNYCGLDSSIVEKIGEVNAKKFGRMTPGTKIPIVSEKSILESKEKILAIILPWHFRETFLSSTQKFRANGNLILFPIPDIEII
jgi:hypothetical protein